MIPRKAKTLYQPTADNTDTDIQLVEDIVSFYWKEIKRAMIEGKFHNIYADNFGTFKVRKDKLSELIIKFEDNYKNYKPTTFRKCIVLQEAKQKVDILNRLQEFVDSDQNKREQTKLKRYGKNYKGSLGSS